tara:strand:+ start:7362 stop:7847 length:486 start_codon:yes stop_codon:yes gene_type:complete
MSEGVISSICGPALVYLSFSLVQIIIDIYKAQFYTAFFKFWTMLLITTILNILCERGLETVSWMFVFIPIITMTILLVILIYFLGFNPGQINKKFNVTQEQQQQQNAHLNAANISQLIKREIELQKKMDTETTDTVDDIIKLNESFTDGNKLSLFTPSDFL